MNDEILCVFSDGDRIVYLSLSTARLQQDNLKYSGFKHTATINSREWIRSIIDGSLKLEQEKLQFKGVK
jgi:uncharacterized Rossmann fold enzyme